MICRIIIIFSIFLPLILVSPQAGSRVQSQIVIFPFDQMVDSQNFPWVSEALADLLSQAGDIAGKHIISRNDRLDAYNTLGFSPWRRPTLAMQIKMAEYLQATHIIYGTYQTDGKTLSTEVSLLDLQQLILLKRFLISSPLSKLPDMKKELCKRLFDDVSKDVSSCDPMVNGEEEISGQAYEWFIKAIMEDSYERREEYLQQVLQISPHFHRAIVILGRLYFDNLQLDSAEQLLRGIENERSKIGAEACMILGEIYLEKKDYSSAVRVLKKGVSYGGSGKSHFLLAKAYVHLGDFENAIMESDLSLKLDPTDIDAREFRKSLRKKEKAFRDDQVERESNWK